MTDVDSTEKTQPWPQKGDSLFGEGELWIFNAVIRGDRRFLAYIEGYKRAGDGIWEGIERNPSSAGVDYLVFPMIFTYRHYIELSIKDVLAEGKFLDSTFPEFPPHHKLRELWTMAKGTIKQIGPDVSDVDLDAMTALVDELDRLDRESFAFRYPITKKGQPLAK